MHMYTNTGVTEDDFSFFDKPNQELLSPESMNFASPPSGSRRQDVEIRKELDETDRKMQDADSRGKSIVLAKNSPEDYSVEIAKQNMPSRDLVGTPEDYEVMEMEEDAKPIQDTLQSATGESEEIETEALGENSVRPSVLSTNAPR